MNKKSGGLLVAALFIAALNLRPAINSIAPLLETLREELQISASFAGLLTAIPVLCMGLFSPVAAGMARRWGIERVIGTALVLIGAGTALRFYAHSPLVLIVTAFGAGLGIASVSPLLSGFIKRYFPGRISWMIAIYTTALTIGAALASSLSAPLQAAAGGSWRIALGSWSLLAVLAVPIWWLFVLRRMPARAPAAGAEGLPDGRMPWGSGKAWLLTISFGLMAMLFYAVTAWLPPIIEGMGYTKAYAGYALTGFVLIQIPAAIMLPALLQRKPSRMLWLLAASGVELSGFLLLLLGFQPWLAALLIGVGAGTVFPLNLMLPIDAADTPEAAASWAAMTQSAGYVIGSLGPLLLGWVHDWSGSFVPAVWCMIGIMVLMILVQLLVGRTLARSSASEGGLAAAQAGESR
ncbi:MFS transporter [Paenibacillus sp. IB182496]|uniref:MFS transporter n=1 Tax=Paenibacillus sabuli TaxID=2772509 RepID=A0A927BQV3_9BACL|nr:MFS transporter [Paenibacillus sabuli]MBD2843879.1 MFS transporter [Paenibacillus sabuli]